MKDVIQAQHYVVKAQKLKKEAKHKEIDHTLQSLQVFLSKFPLAIFVKSILYYHLSNSQIINNVQIICLLE